MPEAAPSLQIVRFGVFELDLRAGELRKQGLKIRLQEKPLQVLAFLLEHPGEVVTREELRQQLWAGDTFVDFDHGINTAIKKLREALGDSAESSRFIETLPRHGYRFIAAVDSGVAVRGRRKGGAPAEPHVGRRWVAVVAVAAVAAIVVFGALVALNVAGVRDRLLSRIGASQGAPFPKIRSIAVLPLENLSGDPEQEYFADGMTEELITDLGQISALRVISRTSVMRYKDTRKPLPQIARELHVDAIVEGTVQQSGNRVRITANLLYAPTDRHLWAQTYERDLGDVLVLQSEVARAIASQIRIRVTPQEQVRLSTTRTVNPEAHRLYLLGRFYLNKHTEEGLKKAVGFFQRAIEKDPNSGLAYAGLADSYGELGGYGEDLSRTYVPKARAAARRALGLDSTLAEAHAALGGVLFYFDWNWPAAERELKRAIEFKPSYAAAHTRYAEYLVAMGRNEQAFAEIRRAEDLDPVSANLRGEGSMIYFMAHRYDEAIDEGRIGVELDPTDVWAHRWLAWGYLEKGMYEETLAEIEKYAAMKGVNVAHARAYVYARAGRRAEAMKMVDQLPQYQKRGKIPWDILIALGEKQRAIDDLEKYCERRNPYLVYLKVDPGLDPLRSDPRFQALVRRMNFPP